MYSVYINFRWVLLCNIDFIELNKWIILTKSKSETKWTEAKKKKKRWWHCKVASQVLQSRLWCNRTPESRRHWNQHSLRSVKASFATSLFCIFEWRLLLYGRLWFLCDKFLLSFLVFFFFYLCHELELCLKNDLNDFYSTHVSLFLFNFLLPLL